MAGICLCGYQCAVWQSPVYCPDGEKPFSVYHLPVNPNIRTGPDGKHHCFNNLTLDIASTADQTVDTISNVGCGEPA